MLTTQVLFPGWPSSGIILWDLCLVALLYLLLAGTSANVEGQVKIIKWQRNILVFCFSNQVLF